jgi:hypothetical protein
VPGSGWSWCLLRRICLNLLSSARARRETYVGEWIPEPLPEPAEWASVRLGTAAADPADRVTLDESIGMAFLVVLDAMTPAERVAFILQADIVRAFKAAWEAKDIDAIIGLLDPEATAVADGGGLALAFLSPIEGGERIARAWIEIANRVPGNMTFLERTVNGQPGLVAAQDGVTVTVFAFDVAGERISRIWVVRNPEKLRHWTTG